jgi:ABC-2 type transport system permease protein
MPANTVFHADVSNLAVLPKSSTWTTLLGGTLRAEIVLAVANLLWFVFAGLGALTLETGTIPRALSLVARLTPSGALTEALSQATALSIDWFGIAVLAVWGTVAAVAALRWFRFT